MEILLITVILEQPFAMESNNLESKYIGENTPEPREEDEGQSFLISVLAATLEDAVRQSNPEQVFHIQR